MKKVDFLIAGSGLAGLSYAYKIAERFPTKRICVLTKDNLKEANTNYAQGGIASVVDLVNDSFESHIEDTKIAGAGLCKEDVVDFVVREAPDRINELLEIGTMFDRDVDGEIDLGLEGGHSHHRILHHKDTTGTAILNAVVRKVKEFDNIEINENCQVIDTILDKQKNKCVGLYVIEGNSEKVTPILSSITVLATGGACQVYPSTTNPTIATGDGIAIAYNAGARVSHMEFIQFHPTSLYEPSLSQVFLISEALRGAGAKLKNHLDVEFMYDYDPRGPLAPRDIVARAIESEMKKASKPFVFLDARHISKEKLVEHFPNIYKKCLANGYNLLKKMIPVVPAAHYTCGGIETDEFGQTTIDNLFAIGECAYTGLHGANRLASNSLLEALVFAHRSFLKSAELVSSKKEDAFDFHNKYKKLIITDFGSFVIEELKKEVKKLTFCYAGINRDVDGLGFAKIELKNLRQRIEKVHLGRPSKKSFELLNLIGVAQLIVRDALRRKESVGAHFIKPEIQKQEVCFKEESA